MGGSPRAEERVTVEHRGTGPFADTYGGRGSAELDPLGVALLAQVRTAAEAAGRPAPSNDAAANRAAREICLGLPARGPPAAGLIDFALRAHGMIEVPPHLIIADLAAEHGDDPGSEMGDRLRKTLLTAAYARVGIAACAPRRTPARRRVVVALTESRARVAPVRRAWRIGEERSLVFVVDSAYHGIHFVVADPRGTVRDEAMQATGKRYRATLRCAKRGAYRVEVTGEGPQGSEVLANFPIFCGMRPPRAVRYAARSSAQGDAREIEEEILRLTNEMRGRANLPPLQPRADVARVARQHSEEMRDRGFVAHLSPTTGSTTDRISRAGISFLVVRENVARAHSAAEAVNELMNSPAHRSNILARDVSVVGVGVAIRRREEGLVLFVTQKFIAPAMSYDPEGAARAVLQIVQRRRESAGLQRLRVSPQLNRLAARYVRSITAGGETQAQADAQLTAALAQLGGSFKRATGLLLKLSAIEHVEQAEEYLAAHATHLGFAITRHKDRIVLFMAIAEK